MKKAIFFTGLLLLTVSAVFAQEDMLFQGSRDVPPAPVVSGLTAVCVDKTVTLSWTPSPLIDGENIIFRANRPITGANYSTAEKRGTVPFTTSTFKETLDDGQDYYYAVLSRDSKGILYEFFLPVSNSLLVAVSVGANVPPTAEATFSFFDTITRNDAVIITWKSSIAGKNLVLYRSTAPFTNMTSLVQAIVITSFSDMGMPYVDYPVPGVPYYYSIVDEDSIRSGNAQFVADQNTNRIPVEISSVFARIQRNNLPGLRPMPLPFLNPSQSTALPMWQFSSQTEKMIRSLSLNPSAKPALKQTPYVFLSDIDSVSGGEEYSLKKILETSFTSHSWEEAISSLSLFLTIRRTPETTARTHFYLGEAYYFSGNYRKALLEFLLAEDLYYNQSREWIEYVLDQMVPLT